MTRSHSRIHSTEKTLFGDQPQDWVCPLCQYQPQTPLIACPECGCHILLTVKIRRLHDSLLQKKQTEKAEALFRQLPKK